MKLQVGRFIGPREVQRCFTLGSIFTKVRSPVACLIQTERCFSDGRFAMRRADGSVERTAGVRSLLRSQYRVWAVLRTAHDCGGAGCGGSSGTAAADLSFEEERPGRCAEAREAAVCRRGAAGLRAGRRCSCVAGTDHVSQTADRKTHAGEERTAVSAQVAGDRSAAGLRIVVEERRLMAEVARVRSASARGQVRHAGRGTRDAFAAHPAGGEGTAGVLSGQPAGALSGGGSS